MDAECGGVAEDRSHVLVVVDAFEHCDDLHSGEQRGEVWRRWPVRRSEHATVDVEARDRVHHRLRCDVDGHRQRAGQLIGQRAERGPPPVGHEGGPKQWWVAEQTLDDERSLGDAQTIALDRSTERGVVERAVFGDARGSSGSSMVVGVLTCPVASRTVRRCSRPGCGALAVVLLGFDASRSLAWFAPLDDEGALHGSELCHRHAESVRVPKGWWLDDRRVASPQLFDPPPNPPAPPTDCSLDHTRGGSSEQTVVGAG